MRRRFNRTQRNYIIAGLCMILVIMGVGYAAFQSQLKISGTSSISSSWNIQITNIETILTSESGGSGTPDGYNISEPTYTPTSATFSAGFELPGSMIGYIVEVFNLGSIDGQVGIGNLSCGDDSAIMCQAMATDEEGTNGFNFDYGNQDYSDINFPLKVGEKHYIMVMVGYDDVTEQPTDLDANIKLDLTYEQYKDPNAPIPSGETTLIGGQEVDIVSGGYGLYADEYESGRYIYRGQDPDNYIMFNDELWRIIAKEHERDHGCQAAYHVPRPHDSFPTHQNGFCPPTVTSTVTQGRSAVPNPVSPCTVHASSMPSRLVSSWPSRSTSGPSNVAGQYTVTCHIPSSIGTLTTPYARLAMSCGFVSESTVRPSGTGKSVDVMSNMPA